MYHAPLTSVCEWSLRPLPTLTIQDKICPWVKTLDTKNWKFLSHAWDTKAEICAMRFNIDFIHLIPISRLKTLMYSCLQYTTGNCYITPYKNKQNSITMSWQGYPKAHLSLGSQYFPFPPSLTYIVLQLGVFKTFHSLWSTILSSLKSNLSTPILRCMLRWMWDYVNWHIHCSHTVMLVHAWETHIWLTWLSMCQPNCFLLFFFFKWSLKTL